MCIHTRFLKTKSTVQVRMNCFRLLHTVAFRFGVSPGVSDTFGTSYFQLWCQKHWHQLVSTGLPCPIPPTLSLSHAHTNRHTHTHTHTRSISQQQEAIHLRHIPVGEEDRGAMTRSRITVSFPNYRPVASGLFEPGPQGGSRKARARHLYGNGPRSPAPGSS